MNIQHKINTPYKVRRLGGGLVVTLPAHVLQLVPLRAGDTVTINTIGKASAIVIQPTKKGGKK